MAMTAGSLRTSTGVVLQGTFPPQGASSTLRSTVIRQAASGQALLAYGTGTGACDILVCQDKVINATTAATYDLYTGTDLRDLDGGAAAFRKIKYAGVFIVSGGDATGFAVGGAAANQWVAFFSDVSDKHKIFPSGPPYQGGSPAGVAVGATTCNFRLENLGAVAITVRIVLAGTSV